jgi:RNA polymerase sigma factor (sigma-70 family)
MMKVDERSLIELFAAHAPRLVSQAQAVTRSQVDAEDAVQDAMVAVLDAPHLVAMVENAKSWLYTMVRRRCIDIIRRDSVRRSYEQQISLQEIFDDFPEPLALIESQEFVTAVAQITEQLEEPLRVAFVENALEGKTFEVISAQTGIPMGTLMARKQRAVQRITKELRRRGFLPQYFRKKEKKL